MKEKKITFKKNIFIEAEVCNWFKKISGLMFTKKNKAKSLLFEFGKEKRIPIHSLFVFFDFLAIWSNSFNKIIKMEIIKPFNFKILPKKKFTKLLEIPLNKKYSKTSKKIISIYKKEKNNLKVVFSDDNFYFQKKKLKKRTLIFKKKEENS